MAQIVRKPGRSYRVLSPREAQRKAFILGWYRAAVGNPPGPIPSQTHTNRAYYEAMNAHRKRWSPDVPPLHRAADKTDPEFFRPKDTPYD